MYYIKVKVTKFQILFIIYLLEVLKASFLEMLLEKLLRGVKIINGQVGKNIDLLLDETLVELIYHGLVIIQMQIVKVEIVLFAL